MTEVFNQLDVFLVDGSQLRLPQALPQPEGVNSSEVVPLPWSWQKDKGMAPIQDKSEELHSSFQLYWGLCCIAIQLNFSDSHSLISVASKGTLCFEAVPQETWFETLRWLIGARSGARKWTEMETLGWILYWPAVGRGSRWFSDKYFLQWWTG